MILALSRVTDGPRAGQEKPVDVIRVCHDLSVVAALEVARCAAAFPSVPQGRVPGTRGPGS